MVFEFFHKYLFSARAGSLIRRISWLTVLGLFVSVSSLIVVISVMTALNHSIEDRILAVEPHLTVEISSLKQAALLEAHPLTTKLHDIKGAHLQVFENQDVIVRTLDGHFRGGVARGLNQESLSQMLFQIQRLDKKKKAQPLVDEILAPGEVLIGVDLAVSLGIFEGDSILIVPPESLLLPPTEVARYEKVRVKRIISTNLSDIDTQVLFYIREQTLGALKSSASRKLGLEVWLDQVSQADWVKAQLSEFPEARVQTWKERNSSLFFALRLEKTAITLFLGMAAFIASFSMISAVVLLVSQKKREIGLLQAIGFSQKSVQRLFQKMGFLLAASGLVGGVLVGSGLSYYLELFPLNVLPDIYYDSQIPAYLDFAFVFFVLGLGFLFAFWGSYLSSKQVRRTNISESLHGMKG